MLERRAAVRQRTFLKGVLSFQNGAGSEDALVRNLTERGALIELPHPQAHSDFDLLLPIRGLKAPARVAWRSGLRCGLSFAAAPKPAAMPPKPPPPRDEGY
jgi:hypothetical protein